jgi:sarcosine oxidase subunit alpha
VPAKLTALHRKHLQLGAKMVERDGWLRPESYGREGEELNVVLSRAGLCDVSPGGKIDIKGREVDAFLERAVGTAAVARRPGEVKLVASGATKPAMPVLYNARLTRDHALMVFLPTLQLASVLDIPADASPVSAYATNVTSVLAGVNLAGPQSTAVLEKLTQVDLSPAAFPDHACREGGVAKVHALMVRLDVSYGGQRIPSFDLFCGRDYAEYFWDALVEAGSEFGLRPFGVTAHSALTRRGTPEAVAVRKGR